jgi:multicomponent K+:H+ antiporter subunit G
MDAIPLWVAIPVALLLCTGGVLTAVGAFGLLRLRNFYSRVHTPTLGTTLGLGCILLASLVSSSVLEHRPVLHELLITVFIVITAPVTTMLLLRAALAEDRRKGTLSAPAQTMGESPADLPGDDMDDQGGPAA